MQHRFEKRFASLQARHEGGFMPFTTLCDPDKETSLQILEALIKGGADALELGFPFSDPCADGPVIQNADKRALDSGAVTADFFDLIAAVRERHPDIPMSILVYANVVTAHGTENFFKQANRSGLDAVLIPDVPVDMLETHENFLKCAEDNDVNTVLIAPPNASEETLEKIARLSKGYVYVLSRFGTTGTENSLGRPVDIIKRLKALHGALPILGFGISTPEHVKQALEIGAAGAIAGSACVKIIEKHLGDVPTMLKELTDYVTVMKAATKLPFKQCS